MVVYQDIIKNALRLGRPRGAAPSQLLSDEAIRHLASAERPKSALESIFDYLDLPGTAVRSVFTGEFGTAARAVGSFALPGIVDQPEGRPDFGFIGNLLTDPLLFLSGGGAGAARAVSAATKGVTAGTSATRYAAGALARSTTKAGRAALKGPLDILLRRTKTPYTVGDAREALSLARKARSEAGFVEKLMGEGLLKKGGLRLGLPFTEGKTIAFAGKNANLLKATPYYWAAKAIGKGMTHFQPRISQYFQEGWRKLQNKVRLTGHGNRMFEEGGRKLAVFRNATARQLQAGYMDEIGEAFKGFDKNSLQDFTQTLAGRDFRGTGVLDAATFTAKHPTLPYDEALGRYKKLIDRTKGELQERGIWLGDVEYQQMLKAKGIDPMKGEYFPQQWTDEVTEAIEYANFDAQIANVEDVYRLKGAGPRGVSAKSVYTSRRKFRDTEDFIEHIEGIVSKTRRKGAAGITTVGKPIKIQELNIAELMAKRMSSHARQLANSDMMRQAQRMGLRDEAFSEWIKAGAGRLTRREGLAKSIANYNRWFFKPMVTIGIGPIVNPAFHIRNMISGIWQAASHPDIGLASGLRHTLQSFYDGVATAVEKIPGVKALPRSQLTRIVRASKGIGEVGDDIVKGTNFTEREIAKALKENNISRQSFYRTEIADEMQGVMQIARDARAAGAKQLGRRLRESMLTNKLPGMLAEFIEDRMRSQGFVHALKKGLDIPDAAQASRDAFIDYEFVSNFHRNLRDFIPFAQFTIGQTPRTVKTILENPRVLSPLTAMLARSDDTTFVPPWVAEQPHFPIGKGREGDPMFLAGLGTPFEDINKFWTGGLGRTLQKAGGATSPPIKYLLERAAGKDLHFGTELGTYRRLTPTARAVSNIPILGGMVGRTERTIKTRTGERTYEEASPTFLRFLQYLPISRQISMANQLFDTRKTTWQKSISLLTGMKTVSVDDERELKKLIGGYLKEKALKGDVGQFQKFFAFGDTNPELTALIKAYYESKKGPR